VPLDLASEENFDGGTYDLAIELGQRDDARLDAAIRACWAGPRLEGCWTPPLRDRSQPRIEPSLESQQHGLEGIAAIPGFGSTLCRSSAWRYDSGEDWLDFWLPVGAMVSVDPRAHSLIEWSYHNPSNPYEEHSAAWAWREPIDDFLVDIATRIAKAVPFRLGMIGHEVDTEDLERKSLEEPIQPREHTTLLVPDTQGELIRIAHPYERPFPGRPDRPGSPATGSSAGK
jgi:hypothetical protein